MVSFCVLLGACTQAVFVGTSKGSYRQTANKVHPAEAMKLAQPYLAKTFELRCKYIHHNDEHWCKKEPRDQIVQEGQFYYITRTSYPYKTANAYMRYAVKVHVKTGALTPPKDAKE